MYVELNGIRMNRYLCYHTSMFSYLAVSNVCSLCSYFAQKVHISQQVKHSAVCEHAG